MEKNNYSDLYEIVKLIEKTEKDKLDLNVIEAKLNDQIRIRHVPKDEVIACSGTPAPYTHYIIKGSYYHYRISKQGKNNFLSVEKAPQWMGIDKVLDPEHANVTGDKVLQECTVLDIKADYFEKCIKADGEFAEYIIKNLLTKMAKISCKSDRLLFNSAKEHLIFYILEYWDRYHDESEICKVDMKNEYIAEEIGISTRTLYRALNQLKDEKLIAVKKGSIVVKNSQIEKMRTYFLQAEK